MASPLASDMSASGSDTDSEESGSDFSDNEYEGEAAAADGIMPYRFEPEVEPDNDHEEGNEILDVQEDVEGRLENNNW